MNGWDDDGDEMSVEESLSGIGDPADYGGYDSDGPGDYANWGDYTKAVKAGPGTGWYGPTGYERGGRFSSDQSNHAMPADLVPNLKPVEDFPSTLIAWPAGEPIDRPEWYSDISNSMVGDHHTRTLAKVGIPMGADFQPPQLEGAALEDARHKAGLNYATVADELFGDDRPEDWASRYVDENTGVWSGIKDFFGFDPKTGVNEQGQPMADERDWSLWDTGAIPLALGAFAPAAAAAFETVAGAATGDPWRAVRGALGAAGPIPQGVATLGGALYDGRLGDFGTELVSAGLPSGSGAETLFNAATGAYKAFGGGPQYADNYFQADTAEESAKKLDNWKKEYAASTRPPGSYSTDEIYYDENGNPQVMPPRVPNFQVAEADIPPEVADFEYEPTLGLGDPLDQYGLDTYAGRGRRFFT
tara:strand:+ start:5264 stop:6511 length:1248 start_codon:yes stop_codon:yes gene_type:complete